MTQRAVIYARFSSDQQRKASIDDQVEVCRRYAERMGWTIGETYSDAAISGASAFRPGFSRLQADARTRRFDVVLCEALDRIGRNLADVARFFEQLTFDGVQLHATNIGQLTPLHVGIMGTMAQLTLSDIRDKTKRGQLGRARAGRIPGGLAYGYEVVTPAPGAQEAGERRIRPDQAPVVVRIFRDFAAGKSPRRIAHELNDGGSARSGRSRVDRHHDPRPGGSRHRHPQQRHLCGPARMEPLLLRQGPAHRAPCGPPQSARAVRLAARPSRTVFGSDS